MLVDLLLQLPPVVLEVAFVVGSMTVEEVSVEASGVVIAEVMVVEEEVLDIKAEEASAVAEVAMVVVPPLLTLLQVLAAADVVATALVGMEVLRMVARTDRAQDQNLTEVGTTTGAMDPTTTDHLTAAVVDGTETVEIVGLVDSQAVTGSQSDLEMVGMVTETGTATGTETDHETAIVMAAAETMITDRGRDTTKAMVMMIPANEGTSSL